MAVKAAKLSVSETSRGDWKDVGFAIGVVFILCVFFLPIPAFLIDLGLACSIALSVLILMVALWIHKPLELSAFPTILLVATILRLALNIATTRLILAKGADGENAAGYIIAGFSRLVMSGDFVIGLTVFAILVTVNFLVITKGATRIAEVGARFTLDAIPGKQMAIDSDLSAGLIDEREAQSRRRELEEESAFFGSMDGASKFVRGDAIAGIIILIVNIFGGIIIGVTRHGLSLSSAADIYTKLSVGDGLVSQIPALVVSLAAGLLVSKGGMRGSAEQNIVLQIGRYPKALLISGSLLIALALMPGLPFVPFAILGGTLIYVGVTASQRDQTKQVLEEAAINQLAEGSANEQRTAIELLKAPSVEIAIGKQIWVHLFPRRAELAQRMNKLRRNFAKQYGFIIPDIKLTDEIALATKTYEIRIHGTVVAKGELRLGEQMIVLGHDAQCDLPGHEGFDPAFGMKALWISDGLSEEARRLGFEPVDCSSVLLTHLAEVIRSNLAQLLSYRDMRLLVDRLEPEYARLVEEIIPASITYSALHSVLKLLLSERVSIRNLELILESLSEAAPFVRRPEHLVEHVRLRLAPQICSELAANGTLSILRLGQRWDQFFHHCLKRDGKGEVVGFDADPSMIEEFAGKTIATVRRLLDQGETFAIVVAPEARPYVKLIVGRMFSHQPVLAHTEIATGVALHALGSIE